MAAADCVLLAAGASSRMGRWKMLLPWRGSTVVEAAAEAALQAGLRLILVVGHRGEELAALFKGRPGVEVVENEDYARGLFSSVKAGAAAVRAPRFFVALGDMPLVTAAVYRRLLDAAPAAVVRPVYAGRSGHPVLLASTLIPAILAAPADSTLRKVLQEAAGTEVAVEEAGVTVDLDEPEDYERLAGG